MPDDRLTEKEKPDDTINIAGLKTGKSAGTLKTTQNLI